MRDSSTLEVELFDGAVLCFVNDEREGDCSVGFADTPWHSHGDLTFSDARGCYIDVDPLNLLSGLCTGEVLVCDQELRGKLVDRWLMHKELNDEFRYLEPGERIIIQRALCGKAEGPAADDLVRPM